MYQSILVPLVLDHEHDNAKALAVAQHLLSDGGTITAIHVMDELPAYVMQHLHEGQRAQQRADRVAELAAEVKDIPNVEAHVIVGHAGHTILEHAEKIGADCVIIASHQPGMQDYFLGSTAARVVRHAKCAVHVIR
ncbi:MAG: universal stress protein [Sulfitobacter sp.]